MPRLLPPLFCLLALAACRGESPTSPGPLERGIETTATPDLPEQRVAPSAGATPGRIADGRYTCPDGTAFEVRTAADGDAIDVRFAGAEARLARTESGAGPRYEGALGEAPLSITFGADGARLERSGTPATEPCTPA